jgi:hypothetical protein
MKLASMAALIAVAGAAAGGAGAAESAGGLALGAKVPAAVAKTKR